MLQTEADKIKAFVQTLVSEPPLDYFTPLPDAEVGDQKTLKKWRALAIKMDYTGIIAYQVRAGFTLKKHAPLLGKCYDDFKYLQDWDFIDEPTKDCVVFWIPRELPDSTNKTYEEQKKLVSDLKLNAEIGSAQLLAGLILTHEKLTGKKIPTDLIRTDTRYSGVDRLSLYWREGRLDCGRWSWGDGRSSNLAVFAVGVALGH